MGCTAHCLLFRRRHRAPKFSGTLQDWAAENKANKRSRGIVCFCLLEQPMNPYPNDSQALRLGHTRYLEFSWPNDFSCSPSAAIIQYPAVYRGEVRISRRLGGFCWIYDSVTEPKLRMGLLSARICFPNSFIARRNPSELPHEHCCQFIRLENAV